MRRNNKSGLASGLVSCEGKQTRARRQNTRKESRGKERIGKQGKAEERCEQVLCIKGKNHFKGKDKSHRIR